MPIPQERAAHVWAMLTNLLPLEPMSAAEYAALTEQCEALIVKALVPPIDKSEAFINFNIALDQAGVMDSVPIIEALYAYREALLKWQREVIDGKARDADLAIRALRGYTRTQE